MAQLDNLASAGRASGRWGKMGRLIALAVLVVLTIAAAYEVAVALGWPSLGPEPGQGPAGNSPVLSAALLALIAGAGLCVVYASSLTLHAGALVSLIGPAAAAFLVARFYTFDPYYAPGLRRMSDGGLVPGPWVYVLVGVSLLAAVLTRIRPRVGLSTTALVLVASALTALAMGGGH